MKKAIIIVTGLLGWASVACDQEKAVTPESLPQNAQSFISTHFPQETISRVVRDRDGSKTSYDVILSNGFDLDFTRTGECIQVDGNNKAIPDAVINPEKIRTYLQTNFSQQTVVSWEKDEDDRDRYSVELANGLDLRFDPNGDFRRVDD
ncbi:PepSY-like domain-containing protein [Larkinella insperata]|uniref:PepSY-like domain-containing protein n=1 Tax=Larkinella insperata TaxID=332158 RepID=A0ABW3Q3Z6_9BACT|nr:PepSY-like domain-containing protein [Larkinella insperata]